MKFSKIKMIAFDLDGTLVDSVPDLALAVDGMMAALGLAHPGQEKVRSWVGNGVDRLINRALSGDVAGEAADTLFQKARPIFLQQYTKNNGRLSRLYPGVKETLLWLQANNIHLACVTNKADLFTVPLLKILTIYEMFGVVISGDTLPEKKPSPLPLFHAAKHFATPPPNCLMVGDSRNDVQAARSAGFPVVAVSYGYNYGQDISLSKPDQVIDNFAELPARLA